MQPIDRIRKAHIAIMQHKKAAAYAGVISCGNVEIATDVPAAATDGWNVVYNPEFMEKHLSTDPELRFVVLHEATHKAYRHLHVWQDIHDENPHLANVAADYFVNGALVDMDDGEGFIKMPKIGIKPEAKYRGWSVKQIFEDLKQNPPPPRRGGSGGDGEGEDTSDGSGGLDDHQWDKAKDGNGVSKEEHEARGREIERAIRQGEILRRKLAGKGSGGADGVFGDILAPKVDWRKALREFVQELCQGREESSWRKPNRRYLAEDVYMPSMFGITMTELVVGFDTSGSVFGGNEMTRFVSEITTIIEQVKPSKVHVIYWDTEVAGHQTFEDGQFAVQDLKPVGGGGTDGSVLFRYLADKRITPQAIVQFTDGYVGDWGNTNTPTLWAITSANITAPFGTTIHIEV